MRWFGCWLAFVLLVATPKSWGAAERVAVLPLADLSHNAAGVDLETSAALAQALRQRGHQVVTMAAVVEFLSGLRQRHFGGLDSFLVRKLGRDLNCTWVIAGSVTERASVPAPAFGLLLSAADTDSGLPSWSWLRAHSGAENHALLGLGRSASVQGLAADTVLEASAAFTARPMRPPVAPGPDFQLLTFQLEPEYARAGERVTCRMQLRFLDEPPERLALRLGSRVVPLRRQTAGDCYRAVWEASLAEGRHPVLLRLIRAGGEREEWPLGDYRVLGAPPLVQLELRGAPSVGGAPAFNDRVVLVPRVRSAVQIDQWSLAIVDDQGRAVVDEEHPGAPPDRLTWEGVDRRRRRVGDGFYELQLRVWDAAAQQGVARTRVRLQRSPPEIQLGTAANGGQPQLVLHDVPSAVGPEWGVRAWRIAVRSQRGEPLVEVAGHGLPARIPLPPKALGTSVVCDLEARDVLHNRLRSRGVQVELSGGTAQRPGLGAAVVVLGAP